MPRNTVLVDGEPIVDAYHDLSKYSQHCLLRCDGEQTHTFEEPSEYVDVEIVTGDEDDRQIAVVYEKDDPFRDTFESFEMTVGGEPFEPSFDGKMNIHIYGESVEQ